MSGFEARNKVAIVGYAQSPITRHAPVPLGALAVDTARAAISDAGLTVADMDGFVTGSLFPTAGAHEITDGVSIVSANWLAQHLGSDPSYVAGFQGFGQIPGAVAMAVNAVASGAADYVLMHRALHNPRGQYHRNPMTSVSGPLQWTVPQGFFGPISMIALTYNEYVQRYGASREAMAAVLVEARRQGARIPWSFWHDRPLASAEYLNAPLISDPICRYDCDLPVDGVAAFILTSVERAKDLPHRPVFVSGFAAGQPRTRRLPAHWPLEDIMEVGAALARRLWRASGVTVDEVDLPQVYDGFSPFVYFWLECLGYCAVGEAHELALSGGLDADEGGLPVLSGGGALGNGRMHGIPQMLECYLQLSGRAGPRQRRDATVGVACHASPHLGGAVVYTSEPDR
ncbi:MAG TPA: thiolase family protein [Mycobacteriales bacterium]|nr:thiolase family protein [Mycobacteriales bacterium]